MRTSVWTLGGGVWHAARVFCMRQIGYAMGLLAVLVGAVQAADDPVIGPGQDELLATMLGRGETLADGCTLTNGLAESRTVRATYACPWGAVVLVLRHADRGAATSVQTDQFAIEIEEGSPPDTVVAALAARVRAREADFEWSPPIYEDVEPPADRLAREE